MNEKRTFLVSGFWFLVAFLAATAAQAAASTFYVDLVSGNDSQAGTKLAPWKHAPGMTGFSATYSHAAGDRFIFKGGQTCGSRGTPCFTSWTISNSGSVAAGHDYYGVDQTWYAGASWSQPAIDGGHLNNIPDSTDYITVTGSYVTLDNLRIQSIGVTPAENGGVGLNQGNRAITLLNTPHDILIENMTLAVESRIAIALILNGATVLNNFEFKNNDFSECSWGIGGGPDLNAEMNNVLIHDNKFHDFHDQMANAVHGNGVYLYGTSGGSGGTAINTQIYNNDCYGDFSASDASGAAMTSCLWLSAGYGAEFMYNNRATGANSQGGFSRCLWMNGQDSTHRVTAYMYNNACYLAGTNSDYGLEVDQAIAATVENNIVVGPTQTLVFGNYGNVDSVISNNNDLYQFGAYCANVNASDYQTWANFRSAGYEANGFNVDPQFVNPTDSGTGGNLHLQSSSPLIRKGVNLYSTFTMDADNSARLATGAWDIGTYQSTGGASGPAANIYIAQSAAGAGDGSSCANAKAASFFNASSNWGSGAGQIGPGTTVHLCGTLSGPSASTMLQFQSDGAAGNPVKILFENGAVVQAPYCASKGCIDLNGKSHLLIDGGVLCGETGHWATTACNGQILNTLAGSSGLACPSGTCLPLPGTTSSAGIGNGQGSPSDIEVRNLHIHMYTRSAGDTSDSGTGTTAVGWGGGALSQAIVVHHMMIDGVGKAMVVSLGSMSGTLSGYQMYNSNVADQCWAMGIGANAPAMNVTGLIFHDNEVSNWDNWAPANTSGNVCHTNGTMWFNGDGSTVHSGSGFIGDPASLMYNNYLHGNLAGNAPGTSPSGYLSCQDNCVDIAVFNNIIDDTSTGVDGGGAIYFNGAGGGRQKVLNNTIRRPSGSCVVVDGTAGPALIQNNVYVGCGDTIEVRPNTTGAAAANYNDGFNIGSGSWFIYNSASSGHLLSLPQWQTYSQDLNSATGDPKLDAFFKLQPGSAAIGAGANLTSLGIAALNADAAGVARPPSGAWDIGSYKFTGSANGPAVNIYMAQSQAGSADGSSCATAKAVSFFNTAANWGSGAGQIGPGTTVHLCGTFTGTASSNMLTTQGDGASGNPITLLFEPGALMQAPAWGTFSTNPSGGAIVVQNQWIVIDGNNTGVIRNTRNGTTGNTCPAGVCNIHVPSAGIYIANTSHVVVKNISINDIFDRTPCATDGQDAVSFAVLIAQTNNTVMTDFTVDHTTAHDAGNTLTVSAGSAGVSQITFSNNTLSRASAEIVGAAGSGSGLISNFNIFGNDISDNYYWWDTADNDHLNGMHLFAAGGPGAHLGAINIYNNYIHGDFGGNTCGGGGHETSHIYVEATGGGTVSNTIIFNNVLTSAGGDEPAGGWIGVGDSNAVGTQVYNNTIVGGNSGLGIGLLISGSFIAKNNLFGTMGYYLYANGAGQSQVSVSDNNLFYNGVSQFRLGNSILSFAQWKGLGFDANGVNGTNPNIDGIYHLNGGSPAIGAGANLTSLSITSLDVDKAGTGRPVSGSWDIGAYKFTGIVSGSVANVYIAQSQAGSADGSSCANAKTVSFFNTVANWGTGTGQIGSGTTVHLCGIVTSALFFQGDGSSSNPITLLFESGAKMTSPTWGTGSAGLAIGSQSGAGRNWIVIDGGTNGLIEATDNGSSPTYGHQDDTGGVYFPSCDNCVIKNLTVSNLYVRNNLADLAGRGSDGIDISGGQGNRITHNVVHDVELGIKHSLVGTQSGIEMDHNTVYHCNHCITSGSVSDSITTNYSIHDNEIYDWQNWDEPNTNVNHHNGVFIYFDGGNPLMTNGLVYNNYFHGLVGNYMTGMIFLDMTAGSNNGMKIFNNVFSNDSDSYAPTNGMLAIGPANSGLAVFNNTFRNTSANKTGNMSKCVDANAPNVDLRNNAYINCSSVYYFASGTYGPATDHNLYYSFNYIDGFGDSSLSAWQAGTGLDAHGVSADPNLNASTFIPNSGSPAVGAGANLTSLGIPALNSDKAGVARPASGAWDIGAYKFTGSVSGPATNVYIAQSQGGSADGSSCANAKAVSFFNTAANWGSGAGQIGPGTTVHLCGAFTGAVGSTMLTFQGSGTSGNPITLKWEPGAVLTSPAFDRAVIVNGNSFITIDGNGTSPSITNTANGKGLQNQIDSGGISARPCNYCEFKNLTISNIYVQTAPADTNANGVGISIGGSNFSIHDNSFDNMFTGIDDPYQNGDNNLQIYNNSINHMNWGMHIGNNNTNVLNNVFVHGNHLMTMSNWDNPSFSHHHDGIFIVQNDGNAVISNIFVYGNVADGDPGSTVTAWIYMNTALDGIYIFNNVFGSGAPAVYVGATSGDKNIFVVNNSIECDGGGAIRSTGVIGLTIKNNVMDNCYSYLLVNGATSPSVDNNAYDLAGSATGHAFKWDNNAGDSYTTYKSNNPGLDAHSITPASLGLSPALLPQSGSAVIGAGINLTSLGISLLNTDKSGNARPTSGAWDIGAYQTNGAPPPPPILTSITVAPPASTIQINTTQQFTATAKDQFGNAMTPVPTFTWTVTGGSINSSGLFTAGSAAGGPFTVTAASGGKSGTAQATVVVTVVAPAITQQPQDQSVTVGQNAVFSVTANGTNLTYQWQYFYLNGWLAIAGATQSSYSRTNAQLTDNGLQYRCVVTNSGGSVTSNAATLTVTNTGSSNSPLPAIDFKALPSYAGLNDSLTISNYSLSNVTFNWTFGPASGSPYGALAVISPVAGSANFTSGAKTAALASYGLSLGSYQVTVQAVDSNNNKSPTLTKMITLIAADFSAVKVYPNPWRTDKHAGKSMTFANLPLGSTVKLFTTSGHHVKTINESGGSASWDLTTDSGDKVASGIYMYLITVGDTGYGGDGQKLKGKVAVIK